MGNNLQNEPVPYAAFEGEQMRTEIREKRKDRIILALIIAMLLNNLAWLWFFNQFDITGESVRLDSTEEGNASYMGAGASGVIDNGRSNSQHD